MNSQVQLLNNNSCSASENLKRLTFRDLIAAGYALADLSGSGREMTSYTGDFEKSILDKYKKWHDELVPGSEDETFLKRFLLEASGYAHHIGGAARLLSEERTLSKDRHAIALSREAAVTGISAMLRLSGQLLLIGGSVGIFSWLFIGKAQTASGSHQVLMAIAIAFASMVFGMARQLSTMSNAQKAIDHQYFKDLDRVKEKQINKLICALERSQENFIDAWQDRFGSTPDQSTISFATERRILEFHKSVGDVDTNDYRSGLWLFIRRLFGYQKD